MRASLALSLILAASAARAEPPHVVTDLPAVHSLVSQVMEGLGSPEILLSAGANPHDVQLRPSQAGDIADADLLFWVGPELTPWLDRAIDGTGVSGRLVTLSDIDGTLLRAPAAEEMHEEEDGHDDHADEGEDEHHHGDHDPHLWLSPANAQLWLATIAAELAEADPENAATYLKNAEAARDRLDDLQAEVQGILAPVGSAPVIVFHDAYGYFADHFGVNIAGAIALSDAARPSAARLAEIREVLAETGAVCVFPEVQHDPALVSVVLEGSAARLGGALDPSGSGLTFGHSLYHDLMTGLARTIADCVGNGG